MISFLRALLGRKLRSGDRVNISGGYDMDPRWLNGKTSRAGTLIKFIPGQNKQPAAVIALDETLTFDRSSGKFLVLELRYVGARWLRSETVHLELCFDMPPEKAWNDRVRGKWIESHATYELVVR